MKKTFKLSLVLILIFTIAVAVLGCTKKIPRKTTKPGNQTEQNKLDKGETPEEKRNKETESLFYLYKSVDANHLLKLKKRKPKKVKKTKE